MSEFDWSDEMRLDAWAGWWNVTEALDKHPASAGWLRELQHRMDSNESLEIGLYNHVRNERDGGEDGR